MLDCIEFKIRNYLDKYLYSVIFVSTDKINQKITIYPDGCDYMIFSSTKYHGLIKKSVNPQELSVDNEDLILLRLKPYTLHFLENHNEKYFESLNTILDAVFETKSVMKIIAVLNHYLFENLDHKFEKHLSVEKEIVDYINFHQGNILIQDIEANFSVNVRTVQRRFNKSMSISPKEYVDIIRFQSEIVKLNFLKLKKHNEYPEWFKDYSHYYKFFKKFSNKTPKKFFQTKETHFNSVYDIY